MEALSRIPMFEGGQPSRIDALFASALDHLDQATESRRSMNLPPPKKAIHLADVTAASAKASMVGKTRSGFACAGGVAPKPSRS